MDNPKKALEAKEKGNDAFKAGDYYSAIGHYTTAILNNRNDATFPLNRAAAYLKLGKNEDAERDCTTVLQQNKNNLKALFRRGQARAGLGNHKDAEADFEAILKLDAANSAAKLELQKIREVLEKTKISKTTRAQTYVSNVVSEKDGRKLRRIPIKIVDDSPPPPPPSASTSVLASGDDDDLLKPVSTRPLAATQTRPPQVSDRDLKPVDAAKTPSPPPPPKPSTFQEAKQARTASKPSRVGGGIFRANGNHTIFSRSVEPMAPSASAPTAAAPKSAPFVSLFDFSKTWFALSDQADRWNLLAQQAPPSCLPQLFKTSLEPPLLVSIFQTFEAALTTDDASIPPLIRSYLDAFAQVPRISTILLFLTKDEKALVLGVCDAVQAAEPGSFWSAVLKNYDESQQDATTSSIQSRDLSASSLMDKPFPSRLFEVSEEPFYHQGESLFCGTLRDRDHFLQLPSFPAYCTVSYVWGPTRLLHVDSVSWGVPITNEDKLTFMLEACRRMGFQYVWIDTLCIDQSSDEDKGREVVKMREYYGNSLATVVFGDKYEVFASNWSKLEPILSVWETDQAGHKEETLRTVWEGLGDVNRVMADAWFWRVWTLQEAVIPLASEMCTLLTSDGDPMRLDVLANLIMWTTRALAVGQLNAHSGKAAYDWVHPSSGVVYTYPTSGPWCEILREILSAMGSKTHKMHPIKLLELTRDRHSSNPVDRLRGAYGFVEEKWQVNDMEVHREVALQPGLDEAEKQEMTFQILWRKSVEKYFDDGVHDCVSLLSMRVTQFPNRTWDCAPALPTQRPGGGKWNMDVWLRWREISEGWEQARFPHGSIGHEVGRWINPTAKVSEKGELSLKIAHLEPLAMIVNHSFSDGSGDLFALYNTLEHFSEKYDISTILALLKDAVRGTLSSLVTAGEMDATVARSFSQTPKEHLCLDDFFAILSIQGNSFSNGLRDVFAGWDRWIVTVRDGRAFLAWFPYHDVERLLRCVLIWVCAGYNRWAVIGEPVESEIGPHRYRKVGIAFVDTRNHVLQDTQVVFV